jgi:hypothetical protein
MKEQQPTAIQQCLLDLRRSTRVQGNQYPSLAECSVSTASSNQANRRTVIPQFQRFLAVFFLQSLRKQAVLAHQEQGRWGELVNPRELTTGERRCQFFDLKYFAKICLISFLNLQQLLVDLHCDWLIKQKSKPARKLFLFQNTSK